MLDYLPDIESDLSALHGITIDIDNDDYGDLSGPKFFRLVWRLPAYQGALQAIVLAEERDGRERLGVTADDDVTVLTPERMHQAPILSGLDGLIDYSTSSG